MPKMVCDLAQAQQQEPNLALCSRPQGRAQTCRGSSFWALTAAAPWRKVEAAASGSSSPEALSPFSLALASTWGTSCAQLSLQQHILDDGIASPRPAVLSALLTSQPQYG